MTTPESAMEPAAETATPKSRNRRLAAVLVAASVAVLLLIGTGAYAGYQFLLGGAQPADRLPASLLAYAGIDFKPGIDQQRKLRGLVSKFPKLTTSTDDSQQAVSDLLAKLNLEDVDARKDLASWVGVRASAGLWLHNDQPFVVLAVATKDDKEASAALKRIAEKVKHGSVGYVVNDGVAVIASGPGAGLTAARAAIAEAERKPFTADARFAEARKWLGDDHVGAMWMDLTRLPELAKFVAKGAAQEEAVAEALKNGATKPVGTLVMGVRATDYGVQAHYRTFGYDNKESGRTDAIEKLGAQPANSDVAALISLPDLKNNPAFAKAFESQEPGLTAAEKRELALLKQAESLSPAQEERAIYLLRRSGEVPSFMTQMRPVIDALSGATLIASASNVASDEPGFAVTALLSNVADAQKFTVFKDFPDANLSIEGSTVTLGSEGRKAGGDTLAGKAEFKAAMGEGPHQVQLAVYVNASGLLEAKQRDEFGAVKAIGMVTGYEGKEIVGSIRILVG